MKWIHEIREDKQKISARFEGDESGEKFQFSTPSPDANYLVLGADFQYLLSHGRMVFVKYSNVQRLRDISEYAIVAGFRMEF